MIKESLQAEEARLLQHIWMGQPQRVLANAPAQERSEIVIDWSGHGGGETFAYICNPNGSLRWLFPDAQPYPAHLALYNSAHWKARAYKLLTYAAFRFGQKQRIINGRIRLKGLEDSRLAQLLAAVPHDAYAIFSGTVGENRKAIIAINQGSHTTHFLKVPLTQASARNVANEGQTLDALLHFGLRHLRTPVASRLADDDALLLSNVKPSQGREGNRLEVRHIQALRELYAATSRSARMGELPFYQEIADCLDRIRQLAFADQSLNPDQIGRIHVHLEREFARLDPNEKLTVAWAHGDFTSWNMYLSDEALHLYDWELARRDMPLFYDAFHYLYQTGVLLLHQSQPQIERELLRAQRLPGVGELFGHYHIDFHEQHRRYLLHLVSYYLRIYMDEPQLHMQVHWLLDVWEQALNRFTI